MGLPVVYILVSLGFILVVNNLLQPVNAVQMTITPSSKVLSVGDGLRVRCSENVPISALWVERNNRRVVTYTLNPYDPNNPLVTWGVAEGGLRTRADITGDVRNSNSYVDIFLNDTRCGDSAMFQCHSSASVKTISSPSENIKICCATQIPTISGGIKCDSFNPDCDNCISTKASDSNNPAMPVFVRQSDRLTLTCQGTIGLPKIANTYRWYKKRAADFQRQEILENITTSFYEPADGACATGSSTLIYYPALSDVGLVLICSVIYDNNYASYAMSFERNQSVCVKGIGPRSSIDDSDSNIAVKFSIDVVIGLSLTYATVVTVVF